MRELSLHILDIVENSIEAGATRVEILVNEDSRANRLTIVVEDNGRGMDAETLKRVGDPFFTTRKTRHVGLGIPLFKAAAQRCAGDLIVSSEPGKGTKVVAEFQRDHIDRAPLGDIKSTLLGLILSCEQCDIRYEQRLDGRAFVLDTRELRDILGQVPLSHPQVRDWLEEYIEEGLAELRQAPSATQEQNSSDF
ncbi:MAG: ATP-binding protein [Chloroflexi bacterium]|nr:ATP-binding protein [Chloroflexota bacterium]